MGKLRPFVRKDSYMPNKKWIPFVIGNGYTTTDGASGPALEYETVTGNPVSFTAKAAPLRKLEVAFSPVQDGTGDPSPDNVRPIIGWDSLTVYHSGADTSDPQTISIAIGSTVYSGTVDVVTGVVTVTHQLFTFGADDVDNWVQGAASIHHFSRRRPSAFTQTTDAAWALKYYSNFLGNPQRSTSASNIKDNGFYAGSSYLIARADSIADIDAFKAYITTTPLQIAVPIWGEQPTIQLTPQEVSSLLGENNMWSDANGNLTVTYAAGPATLPIVGKGKVGQAIIGG